MLASIACVVALAAWDAGREADRAFTDFALATRASTQKLVAYTHPVAPKDLSALETPNQTLALLHDRERDVWVRASGDPLPNAQADDLRAAGAGDAWVRLDRYKSEALGLPQRASVATRFDLGNTGPFDSVWTVTTAGRERDREIAAQRRAILSVLIGSAIVLLFGVWLLREDRRELLLSQQLAVAEATRTLEEKLGRADKIATLGAIATGIAHEVSTPLGVIVGRAEQLEIQIKGDVSAERAVTAIFEQSARIKNIISEFSRLARGGVPSFERVSVAHWVDAARELTAHRFRTQNIAIMVAPASADLFVSGEPLLLEQALVNLLINACDACAARDGGGHVSVSAETKDDARVVICVDDDGVGIRAEDAARATEPFFTTKEHGTGLGLAIVTEIVRHHRGELEIAPRVRNAASPQKGALRDITPDADRGTRATISLPRAPSTGDV